MKWCFTALSFLVFCSGCAFTGRSPSTQFYILPSSQSAPEAVLGQETVGLAPIRLPRYLDRPQIVTVEPDGRVTLAEFHRWAEPLAEGFGRVLAQSLRARLPGKTVVLLPTALPVNQTVTVQVQDFRLEPDRCVLTAAWRDDKNARWRQETIVQPVVGSGYSALVAAMGAAIHGLAERIAEKLK
ncbi:PqiC family protein [Methylothermus subterraneus]